LLAPLLLLLLLLLLLRPLLLRPLLLRLLPMKQCDFPPAWGQLRTPGLCLAR